MKKLAHILLSITAIWLLHACTLGHTYGPYMGKVVDKETAKPIEGAVVFLKFMLDGFGGTSTFVDAVEVLTDSEGEFLVPPQKVYCIRPLTEWEPAHVIIFKPGYGAYPQHPDVEVVFVPNYSLPEKNHVTIEMPKLKSKEERKENLRNISFTADVPYEKWRNLFDLRNIENIEVGLNPYRRPHGDSK